MSSPYSPYEEFESFSFSGGYYDTNRKDTELYGAPKTSEYGQTIASRDWNSSPIDFRDFMGLPPAFGGFLGTISYEMPEQNYLPYRTSYLGEAPFDLQPYLDIPYPWANDHG